ncbi:MAG: tetratricopeptide repeat protein [Dehalococcoidia bacterium]
MKARLRWLAGLGGAALVVVALGVGMFRWFGGGAAPMVVVLPFQNLGPPDDEYFADGITDAITARLAGMGGLGVGVISRTSAVLYKNTNKSPQQISEELGVQYILEGTVQRERQSDPTSRVRIFPQLVDVSDNTHLWAETYDDDMSEVFRLQSDIAGRVAQALNVSMVASETPTETARPTENLEAYEYFLRGNALFDRRHAMEEALDAAQMYQRAVELDPQFAEAHAALAKARIWLTWNFSVGEAASAKDALDRAVELAPDAIATHEAFGWYHYYGSRDYTNALEHFELVRSREPNNVDALSRIGFIQRRLGKWDETLETIAQAIELDPQSASLETAQGYTYLWLRRYGEAERHFDRAISLAPNVPAPYVAKARLYPLRDGNVEKVRELFRESRGRVKPAAWVLGTAEGSDFNRSVLANRQVDALQLYELGASGIDTVGYYFGHGIVVRQGGRRALSRVYYDSARTVLEARLQRNPESPNDHSLLGYAYAGLGRQEEAIREGRRAVDLLPVSKDAFNGPRHRERLARIYVLVREYDAAIDELEYLLSIPSLTSVPGLRLDPAWDPLRKYPRFQALVR